MCDLCYLSDLEKGKALLAENKNLEALAFFQKAYESDRENPEHQSYYALTNALERGQISSSLELAEKAIRKIPDRSDFCLNLGKIYLKADRKAEAAKAFRKGIALDPKNQSIKTILRQLGNRRKPIFNSLPRAHFMNKSLGFVSYILFIKTRSKYDEFIKNLSR